MCQQNGRVRGMSRPNRIPKTSPQASDNPSRSFQKCAKKSMPRVSVTRWKLGWKNVHYFSSTFAVSALQRATMKSAIVMIVLKKFFKMKVAACQNINILLNLLHSYYGSRRQRDRSKRSHHRQSPEPDFKQRRHRKPINQSTDNSEAIRKRVSMIND